MQIVKKNELNEMSRKIGNFREIGRQVAISSTVAENQERERRKEN